MNPAGLKLPPKQVRQKEQKHGSPHCLFPYMATVLAHVGMRTVHREEAAQRAKTRQTEKEPRRQRRSATSSGVRTRVDS